MKRLPRLFLFCLTTLLCLVQPICATGNAITPVLLMEDVENGYLFSVGAMGTFSANLLQDETASMAFISVDTSLYPELYYNEKLVSIDSGVFWDVGDYALYLYDDETKTGDYGLFTFTIKNDYGEFLSTAGTEIPVVANPTMDVSYDMTEKQFVYTLPNGDDLRSTVPFGGVGAQSATLELGSSVRLVSAYLNGEIYTVSDDLTFWEAGSYLVTVYSDEFGKLGDTCYHITISFSLGGDSVTSVGMLPSPYGMELTTVTLDGQPQAVTMGDYAFLDGDGTYVLKYQAGSVEYTQTLLKDSTPPAIFFNQPTDNFQVLDQEMTFTLSEPTLNLEITRKGTTVTALRNSIVQDGSYEMRIFDQYGNERTYSFVLKIPNNDWSQ